MKITNDTVRVIDAMIKAIAINLDSLQNQTRSVCIVVYSPSELGVDRGIDYFGEVIFRGYSLAGSAIHAFAETPCTWSTCASWDSEEEMKTRYTKVLWDARTIVECLIRNEAIPEP